MAAVCSFKMIYIICLPITVISVFLRNVMKGERLFANWFLRKVMLGWHTSLSVFSPKVRSLVRGIFVFGFVVLS